MKKRTYVLSGIGLVALAVVVTAATRRTPELESSAQAPASVSVQTVTTAMQDVGTPFEVGGNLRAKDTAVIVSRIVAAIRDVRVRPGDRVHAGQVLLVLDGRDLMAGRERADAAVVAAEQSVQAAAAERQAAEAALSLASATHRRISDLRQKNSATASEMDEADAGLRAAQARVESAKASLAGAEATVNVAKAGSQAATVTESYATLTAPFDGIVTEKLVDVGNTAAPGTPLLTVEDARSFRLEVRVDESRASEVSVSQPVDVLLDGVPTPTTGRVVEMARVLDPAAHAFLAKIEVPVLPGLQSGMYGRARFTGRSRRALAVADTCIVRRGQLTSVFVVDSASYARLRLVTLGETFGGRAEIRAGLDPGERIVTSPPPTLVDGAPVRATLLEASR